MYQVGFNGVPWFPNHDVQIGITVGYLVCLPIMSFMLFSRFPLIETYREIATWTMPYARATILIALLASWCYLFVGGVLNLGVGLSQSRRECATGLFLCTWFYTTAKLGVYLFLMERAFVVRGGGIRMRSWHYRFNFFLMGCWLTVFVLLETGRIYKLRDDGVCTFGWEWWALIPLMSLDVFVNIYLVAMFVIPLFRNQLLNRKLRRLAVKALWTSIGSVIATMVNLVMLIMTEAPGWLCLGSCGIDIFANAVLLFYMTLTVKSDSKEAKAAWTLNGFHHLGPQRPERRSSAALKNPWSASVKTPVDSAALVLGDKISDSHNITTVVRPEPARSSTSVGDSGSDRGILPPSGAIRVTHTVDFH